MLGLGIEERILEDILLEEGGNQKPVQVALMIGGKDTGSLGTFSMPSPRRRKAICGVPERNSPSGAQTSFSAISPRPSPTESPPISSPCGERWWRRPHADRSPAGRVEYSANVCSLISAKVTLKCGKTLCATNRGRGQFRNGRPDGLPSPPPGQIFLDDPIFLESGSGLTALAVFWPLATAEGRQFVALQFAQLGTGQTRGQRCISKCACNWKSGRYRH